KLRSPHVGGMKEPGTHPMSDTAPGNGGGTASVQQGFDAALRELRHQAVHLEARGALRAAVTLDGPLPIPRAGGQPRTEDKRPKSGRRAPRSPPTPPMASYRHTNPLKDGSVRSERVPLDHREVVPANRAFRPMVNQLAFDVSELALVTLMLAKACQRPIVG